MIDIEKLEALAKAATQGEWGYDGSYVCTARIEAGTKYVETWNAVADCNLSDNTKFIAAANPAAVLELISDVDDLKTETLCPTCSGSGEGWVMSDSGPDGHHIQVDCPECSGLGSMFGAYDSARRQRDSIRDRLMELGGDLLFMRSERDQLKAENEALRKDAERLEWLDGKYTNVVEGHGEYAELVAHRWAVEGQCGTVREAIDDGMMQEQHP